MVPDGKTLTARSRSSPLSPNLIFLTEAGPTWGAGHLTRCSALATAFERLGWSSQLLVQAEMPELQCPLPFSTVVWHHRPEAWQWNLEQADLVVLDSYLAPASTITVITSAAKSFAVIDDFPRRDYQRGTVIDWSLDAEHYAYPRPNSQANYLLGSRYACLRPPFWDVSSHRPSSIGRILVMFGGGDIRALTGPALSAIFSNFLDARVDVVTGHISVASELKNSWRDRIVLHPPLDAVALRQLMLACDIAICGGGQTLYELAACGLPGVAIELIDNQRDDLMHFAAAGLIDLAGHWQDTDLWAKVVAAIAALQQNSAVLSQRASLGQHLIDGRGALRLARQLAAYAGFPSLTP